MAQRDVNVEKRKDSKKSGGKPSQKGGKPNGFVKGGRSDNKTEYDYKKFEDVLENAVDVRHALIYVLKTGLIEASQLKVLTAEVATRTKYDDSFRTKKPKAISNKEESVIPVKSDGTSAKKGISMAATASGFNKLVKFLVKFSEEPAYKQAAEEISSVYSTKDLDGYLVKSDKADGGKTVLALKQLALDKGFLVKGTNSKGQETTTVIGTDIEAFLETVGFDGPETKASRHYFPLFGERVVKKD